MLFRINSFTQSAGILALLGMSAVSGLAQAFTSPGAAIGTGGPTGNFLPFSPSTLTGVSSTRYQQVYGAGDFVSALGPITIRQIAFRLSENGGNPFAGTIPDIQIDLSTTFKAVDGLSATFSDNVGADDTVVYTRGPLKLSSPGKDLGGYYAFDIVITLTMPFTYDPSKGNLLMDIRNFSGSHTSFFDAQNVTTDSVSRVSATDVTMTSGTADSLGLATQFSAVPLHAIAGTATLEGSMNPAQPVTLSLTNLDASAPPIVTNPVLIPVLTPQGALTMQGTFSMSGIPAAHYHLVVKGIKSLAASQDIDLTSNDASGLTFLLLAGDANNDNSVDSSDFGLLIGAFNTSLKIPGSGYDPSVDFNDDGSVDSTDFSLLINNYNTTGAN